MTILKRHPAHPLTTGEGGDTYFQGDLEAGKRLAAQDRFPSVTYVEEREAWLVELCDDPDYSSVAEWGGGKTLEEAWRYALGAMFGPEDGEYDERHLITILQVV